MARAKKWEGGFVRNGIYIILRDIAGTTYKRTTRCTTRDGALAELARFEKDPAGYVPGGDRPERPADFASSVTKYLEFSKYAKGNSDQHVRSQAGYFANWGLFLSQRSIVYLKEITPALCDDYKAWRAQGWATAEDGKCGAPVGPHSVALDIAAIKALFTWATRPGAKLLPDNPLARYPIPSRPKGSSKPKVFEPGWWDAVRAQISDRWQMVGDVLLGSSMRYSSLARLTPDDVDTDNDTVTLPGNKIKGKEGVTLYVSHRVALAAKVLALGRELPSQSSEFDHALGVACGVAGVPYFSCHSFRHTAASMAVEDGVGLKELQSRLAHANAATTERYIHRLGHGKQNYRGRI